MPIDTVIDTVDDNPQIDTIPDAPPPAQPGQPDIGMAQGTPAQMGYLSPQMAGQSLMSAGQAAIPTKQEASDFLLSHTPEIAAGLATIPAGGIGGWGGVGARVGLAAVGGTVGKLMLNEYDMSQPGSKLTLGDALKSAIGEGAKQGAYTLGGEGVTGAVKYVPKLVTGLMEKTPAGRAVLDTIGRGVRREALSTASQIADQIVAPTPQAAMGGIAEQGAKDFSRLAWAKSNSLASSAALAAEGHTLNADGAMAMADMIRGALSKDEFRHAGNYMETLGAIDKKAIDTWIKAGEGNKETYQIIEAITGIAKTPKTTDPKTIVSMLEQLDPNGIYHYIRTNAPTNAEIPVALAINFRKAISQLSADNTAPEALQRVAAAIQDPAAKRLEKLDGLITASLPPDAAAKYLSYMEFAGMRGAMLENAAYLTIKRDPTKIVDAIAPQRPDMAQGVRKLSEFLVDNGKPDILPHVQRNWIEQQLQEKGVEGWNDAVKAYGPEVMKELFPRGNGSAVLAQMTTLSNSVTKQLSDVGLAGQVARDKWEGIGARIGQNFVSATAGAGAGLAANALTSGNRETKMMTGAVLAVALPYVVVRAAHGDSQAVQTLSKLQTFATNSPLVNDIIARRLGNYFISAQKNPTAPEIAKAAEPVHTNIK